VPEDQVVLDLETYVCFVEECRCWQISGAVYRGIGAELPRIVATMWYEQLTGCTVDEHTYTIRFPDPDRGMRSIFEDRLETSLPRFGQMRFGLHPGTTTVNLGGTSLTVPTLAATSIPASSLNAFWNADDVMITNAGLCVPPQPGAPSLDAMLDEIIAGTAGNPVFTDSRRTL